jgi:hypothetical protein
MNFYLLCEKVDKKNIKHLFIFDFDGTLCKTPEKPDNWTGGWWGKKESLLPPHVTEKDDILNKKVAAEYFKAKKKDNAFLVMMTGRIEELKNYVMAILKRYDIHFNSENEKIIFSNSNNTLEYKLRNIKKLIDSFPQLETMEIWEDRKKYIEAFDKLDYPSLSIKVHRPPTWT